MRSFLTVVILFSLNPLCFSQSNTTDWRSKETIDLHDRWNQALRFLIHTKDTFSYKNIPLNTYSWSKSPHTFDWITLLNTEIKNNNITVYYLNDEGILIPFSKPNPTTYIDNFGSVLIDIIRTPQKNLSIEKCDIEWINISCVGILTSNSNRPIYFKFNEIANFWDNIPYLWAHPFTNKYLSLREAFQNRQYIVNNVELIETNSFKTISNKTPPESLFISSFNLKPKEEISLFLFQQISISETDNIHLKPLRIPQRLYDAAKLHLIPSFYWDMSSDSSESSQHKVIDNQFMIIKKVSEKEPQKIFLLIYIYNQNPVDAIPIAIPWNEAFLYMKGWNQYVHRYENENDSLDFSTFLEKDLYTSNFQSVNSRFQESLYRFVQPTNSWEFEYYNSKVTNIDSFVIKKLNPDCFNIYKNLNIWGIPSKTIKHSYYYHYSFYRNIKSFNIPHKEFNKLIFKSLIDKTITPYEDEYLINSITSRQIFDKIDSNFKKQNSRQKYNSYISEFDSYTIIANYSEVDSIGELNPISIGLYIPASINSKSQDERLFYFSYKEFINQKKYNKIKKLDYLIRSELIKNTPDSIENYFHILNNNPIFINPINQPIK